MKKNKNLILILLLSIFLLDGFWQVKAFEAADPHWIVIKTKLNKYLQEKIDTRKYQYSINGPLKKLDHFLGNKPDLEIRFSGLNLKSNSMRKTVMASAYNDQGEKLESIMVSVDIKKYHKVFCLKNSLQKGMEIEADNILEKYIAIDPKDAHLYYSASLNQKVANSFLAAGTPIKINQVRHEKLVHVGDSIKVSNSNKVIVLEFMCRVMKSGDINDIITVHCEDLQDKTRKAKIIDEAHAEFI